MEEEQTAQPQPPVTPTPSRRSPWRKVILVIFVLLVLCGGVGSILAWKTTYLDNYLPESVRQFFGRWEEPIPTPTPTQTPVTVKYAFIREDNLWTFEDGSESQITKDAIPTEIPYWTGLPELWYSSPQLSPDSEKIAFLKNSGTDARSLCVVDFDGKNYQLLANNVSWIDSVVRWSSNSKKIFYVSEGEWDSQKGYARKVFSIDIINKAKKAYGTYYVSGGCGGGSPDPASHLTSAERAGATVGGAMPVFELSPQESNILHLTTCGGGIGLLNLKTKKDKAISKKLRRAVFSPDGDKIAGILDGQIAVFDLHGKKTKSIATTETPMVLFWPASDTIYYTTRTHIKTVKVNEAASEAVYDVFGALGSVECKVYKASLWSIKTDGTNENKITEKNVHALRPLYVSEDSGQIILSAVENADKLVEWVNKNKTKEGISEHYPKVNVLKWAANQQTTVITNASETTIYVSQ